MNASRENTNAIVVMPLASTQKEVILVLATQVTAAMESAVKVKNNP